MYRCYLAQPRRTCKQIGQIGQVFEEVPAVDTARFYSGCVASGPSAQAVQPLAHGENSAAFHHLPVLIEIIDSQDKIDLLRPFLDQAAQQGLVTLEDVRVIQYHSNPEKHR
ncbi:MAG: DUF190 domain-containing protein [Chloroflexi bacterium]|nr:DUF190 domain-containing protein [Chloroflexota bacterium]